MTPSLTGQRSRSKHVSGNGNEEVAARKTDSAIEPSGSVHPEDSLLQEATSAAYGDQLFPSATEATSQDAAGSLRSRQNQSEMEIAIAVKIILRNLGEDPGRDGLLKTPERFARMVLFFTQGYHMSLPATVNDAIFDVDCNDLVSVRNVDISSLCEHHLLPFIGKVHIGYVPKGRVLGLSKLARIAEMYARRLQVQERLTQEIAHAIDRAIEPQGVAIVVECSHTCMSMRGVMQTNAITVTRCRVGIFQTDSRLDDQFHALLETPSG